MPNTRIYIRRIGSVFLFTYLIFLSISSSAQTHILPVKRDYKTERILDIQRPVIDGKLTDAIWEEENWATDFIQREPNENIAPSEQTAFKIVYDAKYIYVGIRNYDTKPSEINTWMSRRDGFEGDYVEVIFDSYYDLRSAFSLTVTAAGVKGDKVITLNGSQEDLSWNPIWYTKSHIDEKGWTAEMKIPFSQLRFGDDLKNVWGLQVKRKFFRNDEISVWQRIPLDASGWVSEFGKLLGLKGLKSQKQIEIQPFLVTSLENFEKEPENPFRDSDKKSVNMGLDGKIGISNDLTLDFTINPDFGQVEADPAAIALDGFQLFFEEQRPFFVENKNIFNYQFSSPVIGGQFSSDNLFYSRRIGRNPQGSATVLEGEFVKVPERTTILGAVKFSGKTKEGLSIGVLESITANEYARVHTGSHTKKELVEPLTNYFVARVQQDFNNKNTFIGGIITSTKRKIEGSVDFLHTSALSAGLDVLHQWKERSWYAGLNLVMSQVKGSEQAILRTQRSIAHLFQRVDASHVFIDSSRTSLAGTGGDVKFGKAGRGHVKFEVGLTWRSPELELNDVGFLREADDIQNYAGITYSSLKPFGVFRKASVGYRHWLVWDFEGNSNYFDWDVEANGTFNNNWNATFGLYSQPHIYSKSLLQGGPRLFLPDQYGAWWAIGTDPRKKVFFDLNGWTKTGNADSYFLFETGIQATYQALKQFSLSFTPRLTTIKHRIQYNSQLIYKGEHRYIMSRLDQETLSMTVRLNYTINPNLSIQYYGQAFITRGKYDDFNYVIHPLAKSQSKQLAFFKASQISRDASLNQYVIDEDENGVNDYSFNNPDFSFAQFRSNLVLRYEYKPGSELFLVWAQGITDFASPQGRLSESFRNQIFGKKAGNTFLLKATFRFL